MPTKYQDAPEVRTIAQDLIETYRADLGHLEGQRVVYCWRNKAQAKQGKCVLGTASIVTGRNALLASRGSLGTEDWSEGADFAFFVVEIAADAWKDLSEPQRRALVFHELLHCGEDDDGKPLLLPHDIEEFNRTAAEFGLWKGDVERFAAALDGARGTLRLPLEVDDLEDSMVEARRPYSVTIPASARPALERAAEQLRTAP